MHKMIIPAVLCCSLAVSLSAAAQSKESLTQTIEKDAERVIERLEETDVQCAWWYFENGIRKNSAGAEITDAQAQGRLGYYQCQGACAKGECAAKQSTAKPGYWRCDCAQ